MFGKSFNYIVINNNGREVKEAKQNESLKNTRPLERLL